MHTTCPHCSISLEIPAHYEGREIRCTSCARSFIAVSMAPPALPASPALSYRGRKTPFTKGEKVFAGICIAAVVAALSAGIVKEQREESSHQATMREHAVKSRILENAVIKATAEASDRKAARLERERVSILVLKSVEDYAELQKEHADARYRRGAITEAERDRLVDGAEARLEKERQDHDDFVWGKGKSP